MQWAVGDELLLERSRGWPEFRERCVTGLPPGSRALYVQAYPGIYGGDVRHHNAVVAGGVDMSDFSLYLEQIKQDAQRAVARQRLRVTPDMNQALGSYTMTAVHLRALVEHTRLPREADCPENTRFVWLSDLFGELRDFDNPLARHYLDGVDRGVPMGSVWLAMRPSDTGEEEIAAAMLSSYQFDIGHASLHAAIAEVPGMPPSLLEYGHFWREVHDNRSLDAVEAMQRIAMQAI